MNSFVYLEGLFSRLHLRSFVVSLHCLQVVKEAVFLRWFLVSAMVVGISGISLSAMAETVTNAGAKAPEAATVPTKHEPVAAPSRLKVHHVKGEGIAIDLLGDQQWVLTIGVMAFARMEYINNISDLSFAKDDHDLYTGTRFRLRLGVQMLRHIGGVMTIQDARFWGNGLPQQGHVRFRSDTESVLAGQLFLGVSLFEGYVYLDKPLSLPIRIEVGRMIFEYGDGFVLGDPAFGVQGQSLDAVRLKFMLGRWQLDLFWAKLRATVDYTDTAACTDGCAFEGDDLAGLYAMWKISPRNSLDIYGLFYLQAPVTGGVPMHSYIGILGTRWAYQANGLKASVELILETGSDRGQAMVAFGGLARLVYQFPVALSPFVGVQFLMGTGGGQSGDGLQTAFLPLFSRRRRFYGQLNMFATTNLIQPMVMAGFRPHPTLTISANARQSFMMNPKAALRNGGHAILAQQANGTHSVLGMEVDASIAWRPYSVVLFDMVAGVFLPTAGDAMSQFLDNEGKRLFGDEPAMLLYLRSWVYF